MSRNYGTCSWCGATFNYDNGYNATRVSGWFCSVKCVKEATEAEEELQSKEYKQFNEEPTGIRMAILEKDTKFIKMFALYHIKKGINPLESKVKRHTIIQFIEEYKNDFYNRECPMCAETVKSKALICKECGHEFEDGQERRTYILEWEKRAKQFDLYPWLQEEIKKEEWKLTPEGIAEQKANEEAEKKAAKEAKEKATKEAEERAAKEALRKKNARDLEYQLRREREQQRIRDLEERIERKQKEIKNAVEAYEWLSINHGSLLFRIVFKIRLLLSGKEGLKERFSTNSHTFVEGILLTYKEEGGPDFKDQD